MKSVFSLLLASALIVSAGCLSAEAASSLSLDRAAGRLLACARTGIKMPRCLPQLMDPVFVAFAGGVSRLRAMMENSPTREAIEKGNGSGAVLQFSRTVIRVTSPIIQIGDVHYASLESQYPVTDGVRSMMAIDQFLAVSRDGGRKWYFVRPDPRQRALVERFYPGAWDRLGLTGSRFVPVPGLGASFLGQPRRLYPRSTTR
jgi:hypothetical protein